MSNNRLIKFRGKRLDTGKWVYGSVVINKNGTAWVKDTDYNVNNGRIDLIPSQVHLETVGQFTGITDKNGVEIYEGDVCHFVDHPTNVESCTTAVQFSEGSFVDGYWGRQIKHYGSQWIEVIGNIHDKQI